MATDMNRHIWEGWTVGMFISELAPIVEMIMTGQSWRRPFTLKSGACRVVQGESAFLQETYPGSE